MTDDLTRRRLFKLAGASAAGAAGLSIGGCAIGSAASSADSPGSSGSSAPSGAVPTLVTTTADSSAGFVTQPHLTPPQIKVQRYSGLGPDSKYIFLNAPYSGPGHGGTIILNSAGQLVWFGPNTVTEHRMNFNMQMYQGKPALTWWQGLVTEGFGKGNCIIADDTYKVIATIKAVGSGLMCDLHEFFVTPQNTAMIVAYRPTGPGYDLRPYRGPSNGYILSGVAQEIDIATGQLLFEWDSIKDGARLFETYATATGGDGGFGTAAKPFNYFHINSVCPFDQDHWLISGRNTFTVYLVHKKTKQIVWRMGLPNHQTHLSIQPAAVFHWQHHVRPHGNGIFTVFDNGVPNEPQSRALVLHLDPKGSPQVTLRKAYTHPSPLQGGAMGSAQLLSDGMFVGWGTSPNFSQFDSAGKLVLDGQIIKGDPSYRAFTEPWVGRPTGNPAAAARHRTGGATVYASWNGATGIASWAVFAGTTPSTLTKIGSGRRTGFETAIQVSKAGPYFQVQALDPGGHVMGTSAPVKIA